VEGGSQVSCPRHLNRNEAQTCGFHFAGGTHYAHVGSLSMRMSSLRVQLGAIDDGLITNERSIQRVEHLIVRLSEEDEDREGAQRLLVHLTGIRRRFEAIRLNLLNELAIADRT
jgi:hypothetical protein